MTQTTQSNHTAAAHNGAAEHHLATMLREGTHTSHRMAETTPYMQAFFRGKVDAPSYGHMLRQLFPVYVAMEDNLRALKHDPCYGKLHYPELWRSDALREDLVYFLGEHWGNIHLLPATKNYVERIHTLAKEWPAGLVPHHYTRYLGDLSGGQAIKKVIVRSYQLNGKGHAFYDFPGVPDIKAFKDDYHHALDTMPIDHAEAERLVDEANRAFEMNMHVFAGLHAEQPA